MVVVTIAVMVTASRSMSTSCNASSAWPFPSHVKKTASTTIGYAARTNAPLLSVPARERASAADARRALRALSSKRIALSQRG